MNHLAFRRDTSDEDLVVRFAVEVGSPELLQMLYVLTAADLGAVGPGVWDGWKAEVLTDLYHRTMQHLAGDSPATTVDDLFDQRREEIRACLGPLERRSLVRPAHRRPDARLPERHAARRRSPPTCACSTAWRPAGSRPRRPSTCRRRATVQFTVGTSEEVTPGIFHQLTGALTSHGLRDPLGPDQHAGRRAGAGPLLGPRPGLRRRAAAGAAGGDQRAPWCDRSAAGRRRPPSFRRTWQLGGTQRRPAPRLRTQVNTDNSTSDRYTIIDVFTLDRTGLLYAITRTLFELGLSVWRAKIGTYLDQVVDVFYVTDQGPTRSRTRRGSRKSAAGCWK